MMYFYVNSDQSIAYAGERMGLENFCHGTTEHALNVVKLRNTELPQGVNENNLGELAHRAYYFKEEDDRYEFSKDNPVDDDSS